MANLFGNAKLSNLYLLLHFMHIEWLSLKDITWHIYDAGRCSVLLPWEPLPQEILMKMVHCYPMLCWLQSDLMPENVAILQQEHPEITFVPNWITLDWSSTLYISITLY
jgi:hypothetical protein